MTSKFARGAVALISAAGLLLAGCQQGSNSQKSTDGVTTLQFQSLSDQPATQRAVQGIVDKWNTDHPEVQVKIIQAGWDGTYDKLVTQFTGGTAPDIIHFEAASITSFARDGYLADLSNEIDPALKSSISQGIWDSVTVKDQIIAYPSTLQSYMVFANAKLLKQAGVDVPTGDSMTWDQFQQIAKATSKDGRHGVGWGLSSPTSAMMSLSMGFGGGFFTGQGTDVTINVGDGELAVPQRIHAMATTDKSIDKTSLTQSGSDVLASFYAGKVAMTVQGSYQATNIAKDAPKDLDWVVLPPLAGSAGAVQAANPQTYSVNADSAHVKEAAQFLNYFLGADNLAKIAYADALIPSSQTAREAMAKLGADTSAWKTILASGEGLKGAPFLKVDKYSEWKDTIATPAYQQYLADQISLDQLRSQLADGWKQIAR